MAITLMTTTGTLEDVQTALGVPAGAAQTPEAPPGPISASAETFPSVKPAETLSPAVPTEVAPPADRQPEEPKAEAPPETHAADDVPDSEFDEDGEPTTERAARSSRTKLQTIKKLRIRAREAELRAARAEGELEARRALQTPASGPETTPSVPAPAPPSAPDPNEPKEADYATYEGWIEARADYRARRAVREELATSRQQDAAQAQRHTIETRIKTFAETHPDYYEKVNNPDLILTEPIAMALQDSDDGPALAYALANDIDRFKQIRAMTPVQAIRAIGALSAELRLAAKAETPAAERKAPAPVIPAAPPPPTPVRGSSVTSSLSLEEFAKTIQPGDAKTSEWLRRRNEQLAKAGRR